MVGRRSGKPIDSAGHGSGPMGGPVVRDATRMATMTVPTIAAPARHPSSGRGRPGDRPGRRVDRVDQRNADGNWATIPAESMSAM